MLNIPVVEKDKLEGELTLPLSKSISHRYLIIKALSENGIIRIGDISNSNDTQLLIKAIDSTENLIDFEDAGTPMRFYLAYAAFKDLRVVITGNKGLKARPIAPLINALSQLGCRIKYLEQTDCLPICIEKGIDLDASEVRIDTEMSSQFLSALLLIAPCLNHGLKIISTGKITSSTYIDLTIDVMLNAGVEVLQNSNEFVVSKASYKKKAPIEIEADWSAAAFVLAWALGRPTNIQINGLNLHSKQGDRISKSFFEKFGVQIHAISNTNSVKIISNEPSIPGFIEFDFTHTPDMFPIVAATCAFLKVKSHFTGIKNLVIKESNRIEAMQNNLIQTGAFLKLLNENELLMSFDVTLSDTYTFKSYNDHRIAMACSIFAFDKSISIDNEMVVNKSFPNYWDLFMKTAIQI